jgi:hypothetical protein
VGASVSKEFLAFVAFRIQEWIQKRYGKGAIATAAPAKSADQLKDYTTLFMQNIVWVDVPEGQFYIVESKDDDGLGSSIAHEGMKPMPQHLLNLGPRLKPVAQAVAPSGASGSGGGFRPFDLAM